jgi:murein DD-endopeptidase MepM/ murein hydrolase activator NlpD
MKKHVTEIVFSVIALLAIVWVIWQPVRVPVIIENVPEPVLKYGIPLDSFNVVTGFVFPNQNLSDLLLRFGISMAAIDVIAKKSPLVFDVRKIKAGNRYSLFITRDSLQLPEYFVYEVNPIDFVIFGLTDSLKISTGKKAVVTKTKCVSGVIRSSLWNTIKDNNLDPMLAIKLSDIYAWTIDFFDLKKGDRFRAIFDEQYVDSVFIGISLIHAAEFEHIGQDILAVRYLQDDRFDYFDDKGENLRRAFLKAPLEFPRISSRFSSSRFHPILKIRRPHHGVDYSAPKGTPVLSIGEGTVIERGFQGGGGNTVKVKHNSVYTTVYMHLSGYGPGITPGIRVQQGQVLGYVGSTGLSTGPHLDFRVFMNGSPIDPLKMEAPPVEPVKESDKPAFFTLRDSVKTQLLKITWN